MGFGGVGDVATQPRAEAEHRDDRRRPQPKAASTDYLGLPQHDHGEREEATQSEADEQGVVGVHGSVLRKVGADGYSLGVRDTQDIGALEDGAVASIAGVVRPAHADLLTSPLGEERCVYWDVRQGLDGTPERHDAKDFWIEDESGRVLVLGDNVVVDARADRRQELIERAESDIEAISTEIRDIKEKLRQIQGPAQRELGRRRRALAKVATLLCAIRADVNGNVHVGGSAKGQRRWIEANRHLAEERGGVGTKVVEMLVNRWEVVLAGGQRVQLRARFVVQPLPAGVASPGGGYRDRPTCMVARPVEGRHVEVLGVGAAAPQLAVEEVKPAPDRRPGRSKPVPAAPEPESSPFADPIVVVTAVLTGLAVAATYVLH